MTTARDFARYARSVKFVDGKPVMGKEAPAFIEGSKFTGVMMPRFDGQPNGPQMQSMVVCVCGRWWKDHRCVDGACPTQEGAS